MKICALCMAMTMVFPSDQVLAGKTKRKFMENIVFIQRKPDRNGKKKHRYAFWCQ